MRAAGTKAIYTHPNVVIGTPQERASGFDKVTSAGFMSTFSGCFLPGTPITVIPAMLDEKTWNEKALLEDYAQFKNTLRDVGTIVTLTIFLTSWLYITSRQMNWLQKTTNSIFSRTF